jgi:hypothetical protein
MISRAICPLVFYRRVRLVVRVVIIAIVTVDVVVSGRIDGVTIYVRDVPRIVHHVVGLLKRSVAV